MNIIRAFLDEVVQPNMEMAMRAPGDLRLIVNAVLTVDALAGVLYSAMTQIRHPAVDGLKGDDEYRDRLADGCHEFRVLRDLAAAYKHGELTNPKRKQPRLVRDPKNISAVVAGAGTMQLGIDRPGPPLLYIMLDDQPWLRASNAIGASYRLLCPLADEIMGRARALDHGPD